MNIRLAQSLSGVDCGVDSHEDFRDYPLRLSLTFWAILEISWDQKTTLSRDTALLLGKLGAVEIHGDDQLVINPHIVTFIGESLKTTAHRDLAYCQNLRLSKAQVENFQGEDLKSIAQVKRAANLLFGDLVQYQWMRAMPEKSSRLTFYKWVYTAALQSQRPLDHRALVIKALRLHLPGDDVRESDAFRRDMHTINREAIIQLYGQGLGSERSVILAMLALLANGLLIFDRRYTVSERSILQEFFKRFAVTKKEAADFKELCRKPPGELFATIPGAHRMAAMVYIVSSLMADTKISGGEYEFIQSLTGGHLWSPAEEAVFAEIRAL